MCICLLNCKQLIYYPIFLSIWEMFFNLCKGRREFNVPSSSQGPNLECPQVFMEHHLLRVTACNPLGVLWVSRVKLYGAGSGAKGILPYPIRTIYFGLSDNTELWWHVALTLYFCIYTNGNSSYCSRGSDE